MNSRENGNTTEQLEWDFNPDKQSVNKSLKINYSIDANGSSEYWAGLAKTELVKIVGGNGESVPVYKVVPTVRAEIEDTLGMRGFVVQFGENEITVTASKPNRGDDEYEASYRPRA